MDKEDKYEELLFRKNLAQSSQYQEIRKRILNEMVSDVSLVEVDTTRYKWWLALLQTVDNWVDECDRYLEKQKKKKEIN